MLLNRVCCIQLWGPGESKPPASGCMYLRLSPFFSFLPPLIPFFKLCCLISSFLPLPTLFRPQLPYPYLPYSSGILPPSSSSWVLSLFLLYNTSIFRSYVKSWLTNIHFYVQITALWFFLAFWLLSVPEQGKRV